MNRSATCQSAAFKIVAFSRSIRPIEPISLEMETWTSSPITWRQSLAASSSWSLRTVEKTQDTAMDFTPFSFMSVKNFSASSRSNGASSLPSYSKPPPMMTLPAAILRMSSAQSTIGRMPVEAGAPMRKMPIGARFLRSTMAFVHCVVPSIAWLICFGSTPDLSSTVRMAPRMPS